MSPVFNVDKKKSVKYYLYFSTILVHKIVVAVTGVFRKNRIRLNFALYTDLFRLLYQRLVGSTKQTFTEVFGTILLRPDFFQCMYVFHSRPRPQQLFWLSISLNCRYPHN